MCQLAHEGIDLQMGYSPVVLVFLYLSCECQTPAVWLLKILYLHHHSEVSKPEAWERDNLWEGLEGFGGIWRDLDWERRDRHSEYLEAAVATEILVSLEFGGSSAVQTVSLFLQLVVTAEIRVSIEGAKLIFYDDSLESSRS